MTKRQVFVAEITLSVDSSGTQQTFYFATEGFTTKPTDTPANTFVAGYISDPGSFRAELFSGARLTGPVRPSFGQIALSNHAGVLDDWIGYGTGGRVVVRMGEVGAAYPSAFDTVLIAYSYSLIVDFKEVRVVLRDRLFQLDKPIVTDVFLGTGNLEGTGAAVRKKQLVLGRPGFIPPILIDEARQIYFVQANAADERAFRGTNPPLYLPFEGGAGLNFEGYYPTDERLLNAAAPSAGAFKIYGPGVDGLTPQTTESVGPIYIRLGSPPEYDVRFNAAGYLKDTPTIFAKSWSFVSLAQRAGLSVSLSPGSYDKTAGNHLIDGDQTYLEVMADSCTATFSAFGFDALDRFFTVDLQDPTEGADAPVFEFTQHNAKDFRRQPVPGQEQPVWQVNVNAGRTWPSSTRTSLTPEERDIFTRSPWQTTFVGTSPSVRLANPGAETAVIDVQGNDFRHAAARQQFVRRYVELFGARRDLLSVTALAITPEVLAIELHSKVMVKMPRLGCDAGRLFRVVTTELNLKARTATFGLWGGDIGPSDAVLGGGGSSPGGGTGNTTPPSMAGVLTDWYQIAYGRTIGGGGGGQATLADWTQLAYGHLVVEAYPTWDAATMGGTWTLTNGDRTAEASPPGAPAIVGTVGRSTGKLYFEILRVSGGSYSSAVRDNHGMSTVSVGITDPLSIAYRRSGDIYLGSTHIASAPSLAPGDVVGVAVDLDAHKVWFSKNGTWTAGDPSTNTSPVTSSLPSGTMYPASQSESGVEHKVTLCTRSDELAYPVPSGFQTWATV